MVQGTVFYSQMTKSGLPKSTRKFIRMEKARIRAQFLDFKKQEEMIGELYKKFTVQPNAVIQRKPEEVIEIKKSKIKEQKTKTQIKNKKVKKGVEK